MCKASCLSAADLEALAGSVLRLHAYFQAYSWDITWQSGLVSFSESVMNFKLRVSRVRMELALWNSPPFAV